MKEQQFTPKGMKLVGAYENDRNADSAELLKAIVRECFNVTDVIIAHHIVYVTEELRDDGFVYHIVQEVPCVDALIFDHAVARRLWGDGFRDVLIKLACEPIETRDSLLAQLYHNREVQHV